MGLIFTYLLTYGGSLVALVNPFSGLLVYVCFSILKPQVLWHWSVPPGHYSRIIALAMLIGWVLNGFGRWKFGRGAAILILFCVFWLWMTLSSLAALHPTVSWPYVENMFKILLPFAVGLTVIHSWAQVRKLLWVIILSLGFIAYEMNVSYFTGYNVAAYEGFGPLDNNGLAVLMVMGFAVSFFLMNGDFAWWEKAIACIVSALCLHTILFSYSRGGMLALIITAVFGFMMIPKQPKHYLIFGVILVIGIGLAGKGTTDRFMTIFASEENRDGSAQSRLGLWKDCIDVMVRNPVVGIGPANWKFIASSYGWPDGKAAHTTWLQVGAEMGVPGLLFIIFFYGLCAKRVWPLARGKLEEDHFPRELAQMVIGAFVGFIVSAQFVSLINVELPYYIALLGALALKLTSVDEPNDVRPHVSAEEGFHANFLINKA